MLGHSHSLAGGSPHAWHLLISCIPLLAAVTICITRVTDYWHHVWDVVAGFVLGVVIAYAAYRQLYPSPLHEDCNVQRCGSKPCDSRGEDQPVWQPPV